LTGNNISDIFPLINLTNLSVVTLDSNNIIDPTPLGNLANPSDVRLFNNPDMSCQGLAWVIEQLGSPPVDVDNNLASADSDTAQPGVNCQ
ncbi:MAG: hypothetical protein PVH04_10575, partial [Gammaproteobacteria bacterium]